MTWSGWVQVRNALANDAATGVGADIHNHQAGLVPDFVIPNTCND